MTETEEGGSVGLSIGRLADAEVELQGLIVSRTGYVVRFTNRSILARWVEATASERLDIAEMLFKQTREDARDRGFSEDD